MNRSVEALILAGGSGSRMGELAKDTQKCLLNIDEKPALLHVLESLVQAFGSVDVKIAIGYYADKVKEFVDANKPNMVTVTYVPDDAQGGMCRAYLNARPLIKGQFVSLPGDVIAYPSAYQDVMELFENSRADVSICLSPDVDVIATHAVAKVEGAKIIEFTTPTPENLGRDHLRDVTVYASDQRLFSQIEEHPVKIKQGPEPVFVRMLHEGRPLVGSYYQLPWIHIGYQEDLTKTLKDK